MLSVYRPQLSRLMLSGIHIPPKTDKDIRVSISPIGEAASMQRTVNGDLVRVSRPVFDKVAIKIAGSDMYPAALTELKIGTYVEVVPPDHYPIDRKAPCDRAPVGAIVVAPDGRRYTISHDDLSGGTAGAAIVLPLQVEMSAQRVTTLRRRWWPVNLTGQDPGSASVWTPKTVMIRPVFACLVRGWSVDQDERLATATWSLDLEEV